LNKYLTDCLQERGYTVTSPQRSGEASAILVCEHERHSADELCRHLESLNIITSARLGRLRISAHFYNTQADVDALVAALPV
jgi:cysteine desulfurase / selenocysteine lyase